MKSHKIALLGGSNCRLKFGLQHGISKFFTINNFSLGASTSSQRLFELVKNHREIQQCDYIILESSLNDVHCHHNTSIPLNQLFKIIDETYQALQIVGVPVLTILWPIRFDLAYIQNDATLSILDKHRENAKSHGFMLFDAVEYINNFFPVALDYLFFDNLHLNSILACEMGENIANYLLTNSQETPAPTISDSPNITSKYLIIDAQILSETFNLCLHEKNTSIFHRKTVILDRPIQISAIVPDGYDLIGVENWSEQYSRFVVKNSHQTLCKLLNSKYLGFNEIHNPIPIHPETIIQSDCGRTETITEFAINSPRRPELPLDHVGITSLFFRKLDGIIPPPSQTCSASPTATHCISNNFPSLSPFLASTNTLFKKYRHISLDPNINLSNTIDLLRDTSISLEKTNLKLAYELMSHALLLRPNGSQLKEKLEKYKKRYSNRKIRTFNAILHKMLSHFHHLIRAIKD